MQAFSLDSRVRATPSAKGSNRGEGDSEEEQGMRVLFRALLDVYTDYYGTDDEPEGSSDDAPLSGSTAAEEAQLPADPSVPIGALAQLAISSSYTDLASPQRKKTKAPASPSAGKAKDANTPEGENAGGKEGEKEGKAHEEEEEESKEQDPEPPQVQLEPKLDTTEHKVEGEEGAVPAEVDGTLIYQPVEPSAELKKM